MGPWTLRVLVALSDCDRLTVLGLKVQFPGPVTLRVQVPNSRGDMGLYIGIIEKKMETTTVGVYRV